MMKTYTKVRQRRSFVLFVFWSSPPSLPSATTKTVIEVSCTLQIDHFSSLRVVYWSFAKTKPDSNNFPRYHAKLRLYFLLYLLLRHWRHFKWRRCSKSKWNWIPKMVKRNAWYTKKKNKNETNQFVAFHRGYTVAPCRAYFVVDDSTVRTPLPELEGAPKVFSLCTRATAKTNAVYFCCLPLPVCWSVTSTHFWCSCAAHRVTDIIIFLSI